MSRDGPDLFGHRFLWDSQSHSRLEFFVPMVLAGGKMRSQKPVQLKEENCAPDLQSLEDVFSEKVDWQLDLQTL